MKNVTITLDEQVAATTRVEAAKHGKSMSRYISDMLAERHMRRSSQRESLERFLSAPDFPGVSADLPAREELYAERLFHRHERAALHEGPEKSGNARKSGGMARRAHRK